MTKKVMCLLDPNTGLMECRVCGSRHWAMLKGGGKYRRGNWQCQNGCKPPVGRQPLDRKIELVRSE